jgi:predicted pyridoxine 5'-phosphate oxidase superfamily flavin-nucleotide-binding protein
MNVPRFHAGELAVQERAGVAADARRVGRSIGSSLEGRHREFLAAQRLLVLAAEDDAGTLWASPLAREPGFAGALADDVLELAARLEPGDPLASALRPGARVGTLAIDLENRRRLRANGRVLARTEDHLTLQLDEVFWNCPKYIRQRVYVPERRAVESSARDPQPGSRPPTPSSSRARTRIGASMPRIAAARPASSGSSSPSCSRSRTTPGTTCSRRSAI